MSIHRQLDHAVKQIERHKKFQIIVTTGMMAACSIAIIAPEAYLSISVVNLITSIVWIWEK